jgi:hypothetical protein
MFSVRTAGDVGSERTINASFEVLQFFFIKYHIGRKSELQNVITSIC